MYRAPMRKPLGTVISLRVQLGASVFGVSVGRDHKVPFHIFKIGSTSKGFYNKNEFVFTVMLI